MTFSTRDQCLPLEKQSRGWKTLDTFLPITSKTERGYEETERPGGGLWGKKLIAQDKTCLLQHVLSLTFLFAQSAHGVVLFGVVPSIGIASRNMFGCVPSCHFADEMGWKVSACPRPTGPCETERYVLWVWSSAQPHYMFTCRLISHWRCNEFMIGWACTYANADAERWATEPRENL